MRRDRRAGSSPGRPRAHSCCDLKTIEKKNGQKFFPYPHPPAKFAVGCANILLPLLYGSEKVPPKFFPGGDGGGVSRGHVLTSTYTFFSAMTCVHRRVLHALLAGKIAQMYPERRRLATSPRAPEKPPLGRHPGTGSVKADAEPTRSLTFSGPPRLRRRQCEPGALGSTWRRSRGSPASLGRCARRNLRSPAKRIGGGGFPWHLRLLRAAAAPGSLCGGTRGQCVPARCPGECPSRSPAQQPCILGSVPLPCPHRSGTAGTWDLGCSLGSAGPSYAPVSRTSAHLLVIRQVIQAT